MRERLLKLVATGLGAGYVPRAPGTAGSLVGLVYWWLLVQFHNDYLYVAVLAAGVAFAVWCAGAAAKLIGHPDPPCVVIDEIAVMPLALVGVDVDFKIWKVVLAFALFRAFDVWKPGVVGRLQKIPGGLGIVMDDVAAAVCAAVITQMLVVLAAVYGIFK